MLAQAH